MATGSHTFTGSVLNFTFSRGDSYPFSPSRQRVQVSSQSAGGQMYVQDRGQEIITYTLTFQRISQTDHDNLVNFWRTDIGGSRDTFTWNDLNNVNHTVRMMNNPLAPQEIGNDGSNPVYDVTITLREEL